MDLLSFHVPKVISECMVVELTVHLSIVLSKLTFHSIVDLTSDLYDPKIVPVLVSHSTVVLLLCLNC